MKGVTCIWTQLTEFLWLSHLAVISKINTRCVCAGVSSGSFSLPFNGLLDPFSVLVSHTISSCYTGFALCLGTDSLLPCPTSLPFPSSSSVHFLLLIWSTSCSLCFDAGLISKALTQANAGHGTFYVAVSDSMLIDRYLGCWLYLRWLGITPNVKNVSRASRSKDGKQEPIQGDISQLFGADDIPFKLPKLQKHNA